MNSNTEENDSHDIHILVAEDDSFQRLSILDLLTYSNYKVTAVENGRQGRDELLKEENHFDLVLLDLMMPEMDGLELLCFMKSSEKLKDIPVIIMSSDGEMQSVATCMNNGAKDYLIKPIRMNCQGIGKSCSEKEIIKFSIPQKGKQAFRVQENKTGNYGIKKLGRGAAGAVELVQNNDGEYFALKTIPTHYMGPAEKKVAENEISLLKVLNGPTIIRYYDSFFENDCIYIVMEYASGGALSDRIQDYKDQNKEFPPDQILYWMAQLVLAVMVMHSKNILHRDIKTQNVFLTEGDIVKIGDFGISKELGTRNNYANTFLGTPYFMSPEVCLGEQYGQKADIWALGCILYELLCYHRPFQNDNLNSLSYSH